MKKKNKEKGARFSKKSLEPLMMKYFAAAPKKLFNYKQIAKSLQVIKMSDKQLVNVVLSEMAAKGLILEISTGRFRLNKQSNLAVGILNRQRGGDVYLIPEDGSQEVYIPDHNLNRALDGDTVKVFVYAQRKRRGPEGEVTEVIKRSRQEFVGTLEVSSSFSFLVPSSKRMGYDIFIPKEQLKGGKNGQKAIVQITDWPERAKNPIGKVIEILGDVGNNETEMHAILAEYGLPYKYPTDVEQAAEKIDAGITEEEIAKRRDFRKTITFTIDPVDAKDFDDALSIKKVKNGLWEVGIHIADVTHYVTPETILEKEAYKRATSVYLVDRVVPMLPERLSNGICSLRPNEEKLCFSAVFTMDSEANIKEHWIGKTVIESDRRFTYEEAQAIIDGGEDDLKEEVLLMNSLAIKLRNSRFSDGSVNFERSEVKFEIDKNGKPLRVFFKEAKASNHLVEEFMLQANKTVAEFIGKVPKGSSKKAKTFVYRIHDQPQPDKFEAFKLFIRKFGYRIDAHNPSEISASLNQILTEVKGKSEQNLVETIAIRSMSKAVYSTHNIGHYGLSFPFYSHFTSPIRRYPDMMVHRLLERYLDGGSTVDEKKYEEMCEHSSVRETMAAQAERSSIKYKQVEFMSEHLGKDFEGVISGVTEWGLYVELSENKCEGMIPIRDLDDDYYNFDEANYRIVGRHHGTQYCLGDKLTIKVASANLEKKQLDFALVKKEKN